MLVLAVGSDKELLQSGHCAVKDEACRLMQTPCGRRVPASSGPNLPGARTGAAATLRSQLRCAAQGCPCLHASPHGAWRRVLCGRRLLRRWHRRRSKLLSETLVGAFLPTYCHFQDLMEAIK